MRFFGLGAQVMQKLGVSTQLLAGADIYPALERGVIDATEFSMPIDRQKLGFYQIAKNNYFPGWHQQVSVSELLMNKKAYDALPKYYQKLLELALGEAVLHTYAETEWRNPVAMNENVDEVRRHQPALDRRAARRVREGVARGHRAKSRPRTPIFKKIADSYLAFRKNYKVWGEAQCAQADLPEVIRLRTGAPGAAHPA